METMQLECTVCNAQLINSASGNKPKLVSEATKEQEGKEMEDIKLINVAKVLERKIKCIKEEAAESFKNIIQAESRIENATKSLMEKCSGYCPATEETNAALELLCTCLGYVKEDIAGIENSKDAAEGYSIHDMLADDGTMEDAVFELERYIMLLENCGSKLSRMINDMGVICDALDLPMEDQEAAQKYIVEANNTWNSAYGKNEELSSVYSQYDESHDKEIYLNMADDGNKADEACGYWEWGKECEYEFMVNWMRFRGLLVQED